MEMPNARPGRTSLFMDAMAHVTPGCEARAPRSSLRAKDVLPQAIDGRIIAAQGIHPRRPCRLAGSGTSKRGRGA
jgi:hypothetical protein